MLFAKRNLLSHKSQSEEKIHHDNAIVKNHMIIKMNKSRDNFFEWTLRSMSAEHKRKLTMKMS